MIHVLLLIFVVLSQSTCKSKIETASDELRSLNNKGLYEESISKSTKYLDDGLLEPEILSERSFSYLRLQRYKLAIADGEKCVKLFPKHPKCYHALANGYSVSRISFSLAEKFYLQSIEYQTDEKKKGIGYSSLGAQMYDQRKYTQAIEYANKAIAIDKEDLFSYNILGLALYYSGDKEKAGEAWKNGLKVGKTDDLEILQNLNMNLSKLYYFQFKKDKTDAKLIIEEALKVDPSNKVYNDFMGNLK
jgi:tetratricopeptide (TPR) repeat protein